MWDLELKDKTILITGASSGIGRTIAYRAAEEGASLVLVGRNQERLDSVILALKPGSHTSVAWDLAKLDKLEELAERVHAASGPIDGAVFCAGIYRSSPLRVTTAESVNEIFLINAMSPIVLTSHFARKAYRKNNASFVYMSSVASIRGQSTAAPYAATKGALNSFILSSVAELGKEGLRFNGVVAGLVETPLSEKIKERIGASAWKQLENAHPLGLGGTENIADAAIFLLSKRASWISGSLLQVDGGFLSC